MYGSEPVESEGQRSLSAAPYPAPPFRYRRLDCASFGRPPRLEESATVPDDPKMRAAAAHLFEVTTW